MLIYIAYYQNRPIAVGQTLEETWSNIGRYHHMSGRDLELAKKGKAWTVV